MFCHHTNYKCYEFLLRGKNENKNGKNNNKSKKGDSRKVRQIALSMAVILLASGNVEAINISPTAGGIVTANTANTYNLVENATTITQIQVNGGATLNTNDATSPLKIIRTSPGNGIDVNAGTLSVNKDLDYKFSDNSASSNYAFSVTKGTVNLHGDNSIVLTGDANKTDMVFRVYGTNGTINADGDSTRVQVSGKSRILYVYDSPTNVANFTNSSGTHVFNGISNSSSTLIDAANGGEINFDIVNLDGTGFSNGRMIIATGAANLTDTTQSTVTLLGGEFNTGSTGKKAQYGATALETNTFGKIQVKGYDGGKLKIITGGQYEVGINSVGGGQININTNQWADFETLITTGGNKSHGVRIGTLAASDPDNDRYGSNSTPSGSNYGNSSLVINGTTKIDATGASNSSYGVKVVGDGSKFAINAIDGQSVRSSIVAGTTAIKYGSANGYSLAQSGNHLTAGGQVITLEKTDITNLGISEKADSDGVYTGNLIQVGSHDTLINTDGHQRPVTWGTGYSNTIDVADAVKNATLNLHDSTATAFAGSDTVPAKDLINVTYGGGAPSSVAVTKVASDLTVNTDKSVLEGSVYTDYTEVSDGVSALNLNLSNQSEWNITRNSDNKNMWNHNVVAGNFVTNLTNANSTINFKHMEWSESDPDSKTAAQNISAFKTLYVAGDYAGNNGLINMNVVLGDDSSNTDRIFIGGNTSGTIYVGFQNIGGEGAKTNTGIEVISVQGTSAGRFIKNGALVGGLYEYNLVKGGDGGNTNNWYLTSRETYRPDGGSYLSNMASAGAMFDLRLYDREQHINTTKDKDNNIWIINTYGKVDQNYDTNQFKSTGHLYKLRIGTDFTNTINDKGEQKIFGVMGAYGRGTNSTYSALAGRASSGSVDGYILGLYGSYFEHAKTREGWYADSWFQYGWFSNEVTGQGLAKEEYKSKGWAASIEIGKTILDRATESKRYYWQPKAQFIYSRLNQSDHQEQNGTIIGFNHTNNLSTRLGLRWIEERANKEQKKNSIFAEVNWIHNTNGYSIMASGDTLGQKGNKNLGEIRLGFELESRKNLRWMGNVSGLFGSNNYRGLQGMLTMEYLF